MNVQRPGFQIWNIDLSLRAHRAFMDIAGMWTALIWLENITFTFQISHVIVKREKNGFVSLMSLQLQASSTKNTQPLCYICPNVMSLNSSTPWKPVYSDQMFFLPTNVCPTRPLTYAFRQYCLPLLMAQSWLLRYGVWRVIAGQGAVTYVSPVQAFVTGIKMVSSDHVLFF